MRTVPKLEFTELPKNMQEQKIDEYLTYIYEEIPVTFETQNGTMPTLEEVLTSKEFRKKAKERIKTDFPVYFHLMTAGKEKKI